MKTGLLGDHQGFIILLYADHDPSSRDSTALLAWTGPDWKILDHHCRKKEPGNHTARRGEKHTPTQHNTTQHALHHTTHTMDDPPDVATLVAGLIADSESARKYAVFKLQGLLADPSFADAFIQGDGLPALRLCVLEAGGNAQAYALGSLLVLLELDMGWEIVDGDVVEKVGEPREGRVRTVVCWESR